MRIEEMLLNEALANKSFYITDDQGVWNYDELRARVLALAEALKGKGIGTKNRVALISENGASFLVGFLGILAAGAVVVPIDPQIPVSNALDRVAQCSVNCICISGVRPEKNYGEQEGTIENCLIMSEKRGDWGSDNAEIRDLQYAPAGTEEDAAVILFTSGTIGVPKGAVLAHKTIIENIHSIIDYMKPGREDIFYIIKTMVHVSSLAGELLVALHVGAGLITRNPIVPPTTILKRIETMKPTILFANPTILRILLKVSREKFDVSSIRLVYTSGAVADAELLAEVEAFFPNAFVSNVYGITEAGSRVAAQRQDGKPRKLGSVGKPIRGVTVVVKDGEGKVCESGEPGRVYVKTPRLMLGYWNDPETTGRTIVDGWLDTGDMGYIDEDGDIFILGRMDEIIIRGAHKIDPYQIEKIIRKLQGVANCIVFGIPDDLEGNRVVCAIQKEKGAVLERQRIMAHCMEYLALYECPQVICEWDEIPLTSGGKPSRKLAKEFYFKTNEHTGG